MNPAMIATWVSGIGLIHYVGSAGWLHAKITLVIILSAFHMYLGVIRKNTPTVVQYSTPVYQYSTVKMVVG